MERASVCVVDTVNKSGAGRRHNYLCTHSSGGAFSVILFWKAVFLPWVRLQNKVIGGELRPFCTLFQLNFQLDHVCFQTGEISAVFNVSIVCVFNADIDILYIRKLWRTMALDSDAPARLMVMIMMMNSENKNMLYREHIMLWKQYPLSWSYTDLRNRIYSKLQLTIIVILQFLRFTTV